MATVLIAEDDVMVADMLDESLTGAGYTVCGIAGTVDEGIALGQRYKPDLALIDLRLASAGLGTEIAAGLDRTGKLGILYATGSAGQIHLTQADGVACLTKPYRGEDAVRALQIVEEIVTAGTTSRRFPSGFRLLGTVPEHPQVSRLLRREAALVEFGGLAGDENGLGNVLTNAPPIQSERMPLRIARLERDPRGYPIPWFLHRPAVGADGVQGIAPDRFTVAVQGRRCWVCGEALGKLTAFVGGALAAAQRLYSDPPSHVACVEYLVAASPFAVVPNIDRAGTVKLAEAMANHEVTAILITTGYTVLGGGVLKAHRPLKIRWVSQGRPALRSEVQHAIQIAQAQDEAAGHPNGRETVRKLKLLELPVINCRPAAKSVLSNKTSTTKH